MLSVDTNIIFYALNEEADGHARSAEFIEGLENREDIAVSEFMLAELYILLRNPTVLANPFDAVDAVEICQGLRRNPKWQLLGLPKETREFHNLFWKKLGEPGFARRRVFDCRLALSLLLQGVREFATANVKDFEGFGFQRVWNPLAS